MTIHCFSAAFDLEVACSEEPKALTVLEDLGGDAGVDGEPEKLGDGMTL